jgi:hypothetical protein
MSSSSGIDMETVHATDAINEFNNKLSVYIPIVDENIGDTSIKAVFEHLGLGVISRVDFVYSSIGKKQAFLHFESWNDCEKARKVQREILDPDCNARLVYDNPKFWPLLQNRNPIENPKLLTPNIIDVLQTKIEMLENKLNMFGISTEYDGLGKRPRSSLEMPLNVHVQAADIQPPNLRRMQLSDTCGAITSAYIPGCAPDNEDS